MVAHRARWNRHDWGTEMGIYGAEVVGNIVHCSTRLDRA